MSDEDFEQLLEDQENIKRQFLDAIRSNDEALQLQYEILFTKINHLVAIAKRERELS